MVEQERVARTRGTVPRSGLDGNAGARPARISEEADVSTGAVTFRLPLEADLAEAVEAEDRVRVKAATERSDDTSEAPPQHLADPAPELARLIEHEDTVRTPLLRLEERPGGSARTDI
ncbi:hypothetical protein [Streptomyces sp. SM11]|uniref:hypothetical protein n=1 Tax=Streptomyces sp. SM11 TaxID=565557 RepID=UPI000CD4C592|nr:hypothetical protein [Streptomyces sp. SM11]